MKFLSTYEKRGYLNVSLENGKVVSDLRRAHNLSFKLPHTVRNAMLDIDKPLIPEWLTIASDIVPPFTQEIVASLFFTQCINEVFFEFYDKKYKSAVIKLQFAAVLMVVKVSASCKIPLTPLRKRLMLAAQRHFFRMVTKPRLACFVHFLEERTAGTLTVNPEKLSARNLSVRAHFGKIDGPDG